MKRDRTLPPGIVTAGARERGLVGCGQLAEMAPMSGNDEKQAGHCKSCTCDDPSNSLEPEGWDFRCNKPHSRNQEKQKPDFVECSPGRMSDCEHSYPG